MGCFFLPKVIFQSLGCVLAVTHFTVVGCCGCSFIGKTLGSFTNITHFLKVLAEPSQIYL